MDYIGNKLEPMWPEGCESAVSLTFDDGAPSQIQRAVPMLEKCGFRGTFYINPHGDDWKERLAPWRAVAAQGHEIGNHSLSHAGSINLSPIVGPDAVGVERMTLKEIEEDILLAQERLAKLIGTPPLTYCYPCYADYVGSGPTRQSYVPIVAKHFIAGRGTGEFGFNRPMVCDLHYLWSWRCEGMSDVNLIGCVEAYAPIGAWHVFTFHTIDEGRLGVSSYAFSRFLEYLQRNEGRIWVAPIIEVAQWVLRRRSTDEGAAQAGAEKKV